MKRFWLVLAGMAAVVVVVFWQYFLLLFFVVKALLIEKLTPSATLREVPEAWQTVDPGKPIPEYATPYVLKEGEGEPLQVGDIVTVRKYWLNEDFTALKRDLGTVWFWMGFITRKESPFGRCPEEISCDVESGLVGMKTGSWFYYPIKDKLLTVVDSKGGAGFFRRIDNRGANKSSTLVLCPFLRPRCRPTPMPT